MLVAVFCKYYNVPFVKDNIKSTMQVLRFDKVYSNGQVVPAHGKAARIVEWLKERGYIECGCVAGDDEELACMWIVPAAHHAGKRPEDYSGILGIKLYGASVTFYPPARLGTAMRAGAIRAARARNINDPRDLGIQKFDRERFAKVMLG